MVGPAVPKTISYPLLDRTSMPATLLKITVGNKSIGRYTGFYRQRIDVSSRCLTIRGCFSDVGGLGAAAKGGKTPGVWHVDRVTVGSRHWEGLCPETVLKAPAIQYGHHANRLVVSLRHHTAQIGRASCRERV